MHYSNVFVEGTYDSTLAIGLLNAHKDMVWEMLQRYKLSLIDSSHAVSPYLKIDIHDLIHPFFYLIAINTSMDILERAGITCDRIKDKDTRKLIFVNEDLKLRFFLAKGPDVPTYVEHGAADIGVVGSDTIAEENRKVYEVLDLMIGKCRMCVCGPKSCAALLETRDMIKIATKYPRIAKTYFNEQRHQSVDIIKLNGSIELAPIVGLSDCIVDIVETGSTLRENGLEVLDEICDLSARMIVNPVSMRLQSKRINDLIGRIKEEL